jgi:hypothetical protein
MERAYWKAKALSLAAENERLHAALKSLVLVRNCKHVDHAVSLSGNCTFDNELDCENTH